MGGIDLWLDLSIFWFNKDLSRNYLCRYCILNFHLSSSCKYSIQQILGTHTFRNTHISSFSLILVLASRLAAHSFFRVEEKPKDCDLWSRSGRNSVECFKASNEMNPVYFIDDDKTSKEII